MRRKGGRVVSSQKEVIAPLDVAPAVAIPTLDIFSKFQSHRDDFEADWLMLEDDASTESQKPPMNAAVINKLKTHQSQMAAVRRGAAAAAASSSSNIKKSSKAFSKDNAEDSQCGLPLDDLTSSKDARRRMPRDSDEEEGGDGGTGVGSTSKAAGNIVDVDVDDEDDDDDDVEYVPEDEGARQYAKPPSRPPNHTAGDQESDTGVQEKDEDGLQGDYLTFIKGEGTGAESKVDASELQATVAMPSTGRRNPSNNAGGSTKGNASTTSPTSSSLRAGGGDSSRVCMVVPLWSVDRMQKYGGYCASNSLVALHQEVCDLVDYLRPTEAEVTLRRHIEMQLCNIAKKLWPQCEPTVYGSMYTHLLLPLSDLDMTLLNVPVPPEEALTLLAKEISQADLCETAYPQLILRTKVPLVKFQHKDSLIDVDISIDAGDGKANSDVVIRMMNCYVEARPLIILVKYFLQQRDMHEPYHGGLGSYATTLLVISFLQNHPIYTTKPEERPYTGLGKLLVDFFRYSGMYWNYHKCGISVEDGGRNYGRGDGGSPFGAATSPTSPRSPLGPPQAVIEDPGNSCNNAASSLRNYHMISSVFTHAYAALTAVLLPAPANSQSVSPDAPDIALRPTLLSRILHVDAESVYKRQRIAATYETLCAERPSEMAEARTYRHDEDLPMLEGQRVWRTPNVNAASTVEQRTLASLRAAAMAVGCKHDRESKNADGSAAKRRKRSHNVASSSSSSNSNNDGDDDNDGHGGSDADDGASNASSVLMDVSRPSKRSRQMHSKK